MRAQAEPGCEKRKARRTGRCSRRADLSRCCRAQPAPSRPAAKRYVATERTEVRMCCYLVTFRPLVGSAKGRRAIAQHGLHPFIDGSCRREPDFGPQYSSITATCRANAFAPRLRVGDRIAYLTVKGLYPGDREVGWRLVAVLRVIQQFPTHQAAAQWYQGKHVDLPSNCIVENNPPIPLSMTNGKPPSEVARRVRGEEDPVKAIRMWDRTYRIRVAQTPVFLVCQPEFLSLLAPPQLLPADMIQVFERIPSTQNPPRISCNELEHMLRSRA